MVTSATMPAMVRVFAIGASIASHIPLSGMRVAREQDEVVRDILARIGERREHLVG